MIKQILASVMFVCLLTSCAQQSVFNLTAPATVDELTELSTNYAKVEKLVRQKQLDSEIFSATEWRTLLNFDAAIDMFVARVNGIFRLTGGADVSIKEMTFLWGLSTNGYRDARSVIFAHWDEFTPATQLVLSNFDAKAEVQSSLITELMGDPTSGNMSEALTLITGVVGLAVKMLAMAI